MHALACACHRGYLSQSNANTRRLLPSYSCQCQHSLIIIQRFIWSLFLIRKVSLNLYNVYCYRVYVYQISWTFVFFRKSALLWYFSLRKQGAFTRSLLLRFSPPLEGLKSAWQIVILLDIWMKHLWIITPTKTNLWTAIHQGLPSNFLIDRGRWPFNNFVSPPHYLKTDLATSPFFNLNN